MTSRTTASLLLAGLLAAGGAYAADADTVQVPAPGAVVVVPSDAVVVVPADTAVMGAAPAAAGRYTYGTSNSKTWDVPVRGGEASTMTNGVPNVSTNNYTPDGAVVTPIVVPPVQVSRTGTGEASTYVGGQPNANPDDPRLVR